MSKLTKLYEINKPSDAVNISNEKIDTIVNNIVSIKSKKET